MATSEGWDSRASGGATERCTSESAENRSSHEFTRLLRNLLIPGHYTWLRRENARGAHIFVRPEWPHALSLIDDVGADALEEMGKTGFEPAVVVESSPDNFQVWLNQGRVLSDRFLSTLVARQLASRFGGDRGSCDWRHFGRLAGFTNQKKERRLPNG